MMHPADCPICKRIATLRGGIGAARSLHAGLVFSYRGMSAEDDASLLRALDALCLALIDAADAIKATHDDAVSSR
jgi:hypothetical protein